MPKYLSLAVKNAFAYLVFILLSSFLIGYTIYKLSANLFLTASKTRLQNSAKDVRLKMVSYFDNIGRDILFLSKNPLVLDYITAFPDPQRLKDIKLKEEFEALLGSRMAYFQIRLIGLQNNGKELLKVERQGFQIISVLDSGLIQIGDRPYFKESVKLRENAIYFSEIDLNEDRGQLTLPPLPTLRASSLLYKDDKPFAVVIINADLRSIFQELNATVSKDENLFIFTNNGYFVIHPNEDECFGAQFGRPANVYDWFDGLQAIDPRFNNSDPKLLKSSQKGMVTQYNMLRHPITDYSLFIAVKSKEADILKPFMEWRNKIIQYTSIITLAFLSLAFWWMRRQAKGLREITRSILSFSDDYTQRILPTKSTDEIGELATAFTNMASTIKQNISELENAKEKAEKANQAKEEFLENMSHELRNPLQSILGMTNILNQNNPLPKQQAVIKTIQFSSDQLLSLVNDVLDFTKIKTGHIQLKFEPINLPVFIDQIISSHQFIAQSKKVELRSTLNHELGDYLIYTDVQRLSQILNNLIINAIKFTLAGGQVNLSVQSQVTASKVVMDFQISDTGIGIDPSEIHKIKNRYYSAGSPDMASSLSGAGLGLPIVVQLLELFHSALEVKTNDQGSTFSFQLIQNFDIANELTSTNTSINSNLPTEIRQILCIEDDPQVLLFYKSLFESKVEVYRSVRSVQEFEQLPSSEYYDLVISDLFLDNILLTDGWPIIMSKKSPAGILLLISGKEMDPAQIALYAADDYLLKPVISDKLLSCIQKNWELKNLSPVMMDNMISDYDQNPALIRKAMQLLIEEWKGMKSQLIKSMMEYDEELFNRVFHKLITTLRRFQLDKLLQELKTISELFKTKSVLDANKIESIKINMDYYQGIFEQKTKEL